MRVGKCSAGPERARTLNIRSEFPIKASISKIDLSSGPFYTVIIRDVTLQRQSEAALRESQAHFQTMANAMSQLMWRAGPDGFITWYNDRWYEYTGTTPVEMEGWGWQSVHHPAALPKVLDPWKGCIAAAAPFDMTFPLRGADGIFREFLTRCIPLRDAGGKGCIGSGRIPTWMSLSAWRRHCGTAKAVSVLRMKPREWKYGNGISRRTKTDGMRKCFASTGCTRRPMGSYLMRRGSHVWWKRIAGNNIARSRKLSPAGIGVNGNFASCGIRMANNGISVQWRQSGWVPTELRSGSSARISTSRI